jgi:hypothetical protein
MAQAEDPATLATHIMQQVASNQDAAQLDRAHYLYEQHVHVVVRRTNGKLARDETTDLLVTPTASGTIKKEQSISGRYRKKGQLLEYQREPVPDAEGLDYDLVHDFRRDLTDDDSKDGLAKDLFPLTTDGQKDLEFELAGEEGVGGRPAYRIRFRPADRSEIGWAGEALIDKAECQPVSVFTRLSKRIPLLVRTLLGTDLPGIGFSTRYQRVGENVWFPVSFGTEFRLRAVFFINRDISVSLENSHFQRTDANSTIHYSN